VFLRTIGIVKTLGEHNLTLCGNIEKIHKIANENFLSLIEMIVKFEPIVQEHIH